MTNNKIYFIGNWKMYGNLSSLNTINKVIQLSKSKKYKKAQIIYCPPFTLLDQFLRKIKNTNLSVGAQDCHTENYYGAHTGSVSASMLKQLGSKYIILGHSEKRKNGDTNYIINKKIKSALDVNLKVIFCIGETLSEKKRKKTSYILKKQISQGLKKIKNLNNVIIAYEPVWSIGSGIVPQISDLNVQVKKIKEFIRGKFKFKKIKVLYGGSVNNKTIKSLIKIDKIDGFLIGGASINQNKFIDIIKKTIN